MDLFHICKIKRKKYRTYHSCIWWLNTCRYQLLKPEGAKGSNSEQTQELFINLNWNWIEQQQEGLKRVTLTWKYADIKVLSTTTTISLLCSWTRSEQTLMSTTFIMGLVGVSIHTSYTKKDRVSHYGNEGFELHSSV